ncbi:MAG: sigma-70 family RNA polymerase sigma factor [Candidatus Velthaea sp.]
MFESPGSPVEDDEGLARAFLARVPVALDEAYRRYGGMLIAVAQNALGEFGDAPDCMHDAILRVWMTAGSYRLERGALRSFLMVCVRNEALTRRRNAMRHRKIDVRLAATSGPAEDALENIDPVQSAHLREALESLPDEQRRVIDLAYFSGLSQTEIATRLNVPLGTVKSRASLGLRRLLLALGQKRDTAP